jgi:C4-dicarboxylate-specific signal transduction histidine kinase
VLEPRLDLRLRRDREHVELVVSDNGPGFPPGILEELPLVSTKAHGMGIGLFVVRTMVENHAGSLGVGLSPLGGAEVTLRFRALPAAAIKAARAALP